MQDFGSAPTLLKRPLRGARQRVLTRRRVHLGCVGIIVATLVLLLCRRGSELGGSTTPIRWEDYTPTPSTRMPFAKTATTTTRSTAAATSTAAGTTIIVHRDGFQVPWVVAPPKAVANATEGTVQTAFGRLVDSHTPGTAWRDPSTNSIVAYAKSGTLLAIKPTICTRHRRADFQKWESLYQPFDSYNIPAFATPRDRDTLQHASIFTSLASFRDRECATTLRDLFEMALAPHRLYVGISEERKPFDASCLALIGVDGATSPETRQLLYGADAPADVRVELRQLTWADVIFPRTIVDVDAAAEALNSTSVAPHPAGIFLHPSYAEERLSCVAGELETLRDRLLLHEDDVRREASGGTVFRQGRGGPQQQPSRALAGCRVTTRVTRPELARGPTFGRYITSLFFFDQDYFMVVDSHTRFSVHWDAKLITRIFQLPTPGVLSYYPNGYREKDERREYGKQDFMLMCTAQVLSNGMPKLGARWMPVAKHPLLQGFAAAGFMFGDAQYVLDTPFDPFLPYMFDGEEVLFSARMWTAGWDIYGPAESNVFHNYERYDTPKYFGIMGTTEVQLRALSERRTLYLLRRAQPWVQELVTRGYMTADGQQTLKPLPPVEPPESRLIVSDDVAAATPEIHVWKSYYGMGAVRTLGQYWEHTELTDAYVKKKDSENRWMGGEGLCDAAKKELDIS